MAVRTLAPQYDQGYIYTYSDLDKERQNKVDLLDISKRRKEIGEQIIDKGLLNRDLEYYIPETGDFILKLSIEIQKEREQAVYEALGVSGNNVKELSDALREALFGEFAKEFDYGDGQGPTRRMDKVFNFLQDYLKRVLYKDAEDITTAIKNGTANKASIEEVYNEISDPVRHSGFLIEDLEERKKKSQQGTEAMQEMVSLYSDLQNKDVLAAKTIADTLQVAKRQAKSASSLPTVEEMKSLVEKYSKIAPRAVTGDIGEKLFSLFAEAGRDNIIQNVQNAFEVKVIPTSNWAGEMGKNAQNFSGFFLERYLEQHYDNHPLLKDFIVMENKSKAGSLLPKEDIVIDIWLNEDKIGDLLFPTDFKTIGFSIKTSFYEPQKGDNRYDDITIQSSSFRSFLQDLLYVPSDCLVYADVFYQSLLKIVMNLAGEVGWNNPNYNFHSIMSEAINYFAYVWLTGVLTENEVHADFFFAYKNRKTYLIPMSAILEEVLNKMKTHDRLIKGESSLWKKYIIPDEELAALDNLKKKGSAGKGNKLFEMQEQSLKSGKDINGKTLDKLSRSGQIRLSNFSNLVQGMGFQ